MSRLTPFSKLLIIVAIMGALFFAYKKFMPTLSEKYKTDQTTTQTTDNGGATTTTTDNGGGKATDGGGGTVKQTRQPFPYTAKQPVGGKLRGVVELGASGFNSFVIRVDASKNWKLEKADFGASLVYEKLATDDDIKSGLKNYISGMLNYGVTPKDIHFVISSGAQKVEMTAKIITHLKNMGYFVNTVTAEQEGKYALQCVLPKDYENDAFVVDIGSGNTKISWKDGSGVKAIESYGAKYFQNGTSDDVVYNDAKSKASQVPTAKRKVCFIIGGAPYSMAKLTRNGKERFTVLSDPASYKDQTEAKIKAGVNIYKGINDGTDCMQFVFDWDANFTIGFLLNLPY